MWTVISRDQCNFCDLAKTMMKGCDLPYTEYNIQSPSSKWVLTLLKKGGVTTVPQIFQPDGTLLGGYTELKEFVIKNYS
jgi:glutaredoxin